MTPIASGAPILLTGTGNVSLAPGNLLGFYVNSTSSGTVVIADGGTAISGTITPAVGWQAFPAYCRTNCTVTIGATLNVTFFFAAG